MRLEFCIHVFGWVRIMWEEWFELALGKFLWNLKMEFFGVELLICDYRMKVHVTKSSYYFSVNFSKLGWFLVNVGSWDHEAWTGSMAKPKNWVAESKSGGPKFQVLVTRVHFMRNYVKLMNENWAEKEKKYWKHFQVVLRNKDDFENWKQNMCLVFIFWKSKNENWKLKMKWFQTTTKSNKPFWNEDNHKFKF